MARRRQGPPLSDDTCHRDTGVLRYVGCRVVRQDPHARRRAARECQLPGSAGLPTSATEAAYSAFTAARPPQTGEEDDVRRSTPPQRLSRAHRRHFRLHDRRATPLWDGDWSQWVADHVDTLERERGVRFRSLGDVLASGELDGIFPREHMSLVVSHDKQAGGGSAGVCGYVLFTSGRCVPLAGSGEEGPAPGRRRHRPR